MFTKKMIAPMFAVVLAATGVCIADVAKADDDDAAENAAIASATITLQQATQTAEAAAGGKAVESGIDDDDDGMYYYKVEVRAADGTEKKVLIDMKTGKVVKIKADD